MRNRTPTLDVMREVIDLHIQNCRLQLIKSGAPPVREFGILRLAPAIGAQASQPVDQFGHRCGHEASVSDRAKVLGGIEAKTADLAKRADWPAVDGRLLRLSAVLDHREAMRTR